MTRGRRCAQLGGSLRPPWGAAFTLVSLLSFAIVASAFDLASTDLHHRPPHHHPYYAAAGGFDEDGEGSTHGTASSVHLLEQMVTEGAERLGHHLDIFIDSLGRLMQARQRWAEDERMEMTAAADPASGGEGPEAAAALLTKMADRTRTRSSPHFVERVFHRSTDQQKPLPKQPREEMRKRQVDEDDDGKDDDKTNCNPPFGISHPACSPAYACSISKMSCNGTSVNVKTYNGSLANCTVNEVSCTNGPTPPLSKRSCEIYELMCNGVKVAAADAPPGAAATCSVYQLMCANDRLLNFNSNTSACEGQAHGNVVCESICKEAGNVCSCSLDRIGANCAKWRPYTCTFKLLSPQPNCQPNRLVDSDPVCFLYRRSQTVTFEYTMDCEFDDDTPIPDQADEFQYFLRTKKFAVSKAQTALWPMQAQLKVFDFKWISDRSATQVLNLTASQLAGNSSVSFSINFEQIPDRFFAGNRLYFEYGLSRVSNVKGRTIKYDRRFIDFEDLHIHRTTHSSLSASQISWIIAGSLSGFAFLVLLGYWLRNKIVACRRPKAHDY